MLKGYKLRSANYLARKEGFKNAAEMLQCVREMFGIASYMQDWQVLEICKQWIA